MAKHAATSGLQRPDLSARRTLYRYPETRRRYLYLSIAVGVTIVLYYELYVFGGVAPLVLAHYKMSFAYYVNILVVANLIGAFGSLLAGLGDRWGRINIVVYGLALTAMLSIMTPLASTKTAFALMLVLVSLVEGAVLVATPALVRDFSPQLGRASAMGFWAVGPVVGSLIVSFVANRTLRWFGDSWESQYYVVGLVGFGMCAVAFVGLRELSPELRDRVMVTKEDRKALEVHVATGNHRMRKTVPWSDALRPDIVLPALGISLFLLIYYVAIGFSTLYLSAIFGFSVHEVNGLNTWFWLVNAATLIGVGAASDRLRVRKPFMLGGTILTMFGTYLLIGRAGHPDSGHFTIALVLGVLGVGLGTAYVPWMAAFTETVERCNPALVAPGLAIWGWMVRICACFSFILLPIIVDSMDSLVKATAMGDVAGVHAARLRAPDQWQHWWWVCIFAQASLLLLMLPLAGRWSTRAAEADLEAHRRRMRRMLPSYKPPVHFPWSSS